MLELLLLATFSFAAPLEVVTTTPDLAEVARDIGGPEVHVTSLLSGTEDPHFLEASPAFVLKVARADAVCQVGLELEVGWLPRVLTKTGKAQIQPGGDGFCDTGSKVKVLDKPTGPVDRSGGDVHPSGNPHFYLSPIALAEAGEVVRDTLARLRPEKSAEFSKRFEDFRGRMRRLKDATAVRLAKAPTVIEYHKEYRYFLDLYGVKSIGAIEEKPGVPPSAARLATRATDAKKAGVGLALAATTNPEKNLKRFAELSGIPYAQVPAMVQVDGDKWNTIEKVQNGLADTLIKGVK